MASGYGPKPRFTALARDVFLNPMSACHIRFVSVYLR